MKFSTILPVAFLSLAIAAPVAEPQDIDFDAYNAIPIETDISAPVGVADEAVVSSRYVLPVNHQNYTTNSYSYAPTAAASAAVAAATGGTDPDLTKVKKRDDCSLAAAGNFATASPDTDIGFLKTLHSQLLL